MDGVKMKAVILLAALLQLGLLEQALCAEVCYDDVGCFDDAGCHRAGFPPQTPTLINARFFLYTRSTRDVPHELVYGDVDGLRSSDYYANRKTKISVHGYTDSGFSSGEQERKDIVLEVENVNMIVVDWSDGASQLYSKSTQNARVVGRQIGLLLRFLNLETGMYFNDVHVIGMSLGGHVVGYAGEFQPGIGRITGLDPAGPYFRDEGFEFRNNGPECRLDPTDALFVDVIHTDANDITGAGQMLQLGHQDFYPNGGRTQPGCDGSDVFTGCSHVRAIVLFNDTIRRNATCSFTAYPCGSWVQFASGGCRDCDGVRGCAAMGYHADRAHGSGKFYLETNGAAPFCKV